MATKISEKISQPDSFAPRRPIRRRAPTMVVMRYARPRPPARQGNSISNRAPVQGRSHKPWQHTTGVPQSTTGTAYKGQGDGGLDAGNQENHNGGTGGTAESTTGKVSSIAANNGATRRRSGHFSSDGHDTHRSIAATAPNTGQARQCALARSSSGGGRR